MKIAAKEDPGICQEELGSFLVTASAASFMAAKFWLLSKVMHLVDAALVSPKQKGGFA